MILDLFSKRKRQQRKDVSDVFQYDDVPYELRVQIIHIWRDAFGQVDETYSGNRAGALVKFIHDGLCREYGLFCLGDEGDFRYTQLTNFFLRCADTDRVLDVIELTFRVIDRLVRPDIGRLTNAKLSPDQAIEELNARFLEHGLGYEYQSGELIRVDSKFLHREAIKPALGFLSEKRFRGANEEFLKAFEHYRHGRYKETLNECLKAFESVLKTICQKRGWRVDANATARTLIGICFEKSLVPQFLQSQFSALRTLLESGVPTARNKLGGHGQGPEEITVPRYFASYVLHLTATTILLVVEADGEQS